MSEAGTIKSERNIRALDHTDNMSPGMRECVHEYGYAIVKACLQAGVSSPHHIHSLVREIWNGARSINERRRPGGALDWLLVQAGVPLSAAQLARILGGDNLVIVPNAPTRRMIDASLAEVSGHSVRCTKFQKHERRLRAALAAEPNYLARIAAPRSEPVLVPHCNEERV